MALDDSLLGPVVCAEFREKTYFFIEKFKQRQIGRTYG